MGISGICVLWLGSCFGGTPQTTVEPQTDSAWVIHDLYVLVTYITVVIFVVVVVLLGWAGFSFRARKGKEKDIPKQVHGSAKLEIAWFIIPTVILIFIAVPTWQAIFRAAYPPDEDILLVRAIGNQWWWEFEYPDTGVRSANEMYLPLHRTVVVETTTNDVIHSFWVPQLQGKKDNIPGRVNSLWFTTEREGTYYGQCAEYCGTSHALMRFVVHVVPEKKYEQWIIQQQQPPVAVTVDARRGEQLFTEKICVTCHSISGNPAAVGKLGPNLSNLPTRRYLSGGVLVNNRENLARWIHNPQVIKPKVKMGLATKDEKGTISYKRLDINFVEADQLAAYLLSFPGGAKAQKNASDLVARSQDQEQGQDQDQEQVQGQGAATEGVGGEVQNIIEKGICWTCHIIPDIPKAQGIIGPSLAGFGSRDKIVGLLELNADNLKKWLKDPQSIKPGTGMPAAVALSEAEIDELASYLLSL